MNKEVKVELEANVKSLSTYIYIHTLSGGKHWDIFHMKTLVMFIFLLKKKMRKFLVHLESLKYKVPPIPLGYWTFLIHWHFHVRRNGQSILPKSSQKTSTVLNTVVIHIQPMTQMTLIIRILVLKRKRWRRKKMTWTNWFRNW